MRSESSEQKHGSNENLDPKALQAASELQTAPFRLNEVVELLVSIERPDLDQESEEFENICTAIKNNFETASPEEIVTKIQSLISRCIDAKSFKKADKLALRSKIPGEIVRVSSAWLQYAHEKFKAARPGEQADAARAALGRFIAPREMRDDARDIEMESALNLDLLVKDYQKERTNNPQTAINHLLYAITERMRKNWKMIPNLSILAPDVLREIHNDAASAVRLVLNEKGEAQARKRFDEFLNEKFIELDTDIELSELLTS